MQSAEQIVFFLGSKVEAPEVGKIGVGLTWGAQLPGAAFNVAGASTHSALTRSSHSTHLRPSSIYQRYLECRSSLPGVVTGSTTCGRSPGTCGTDEYKTV